MSAVAAQNLVLESDRVLMHAVRVDQKRLRQVVDSSGNKDIIRCGWTVQEIEQLLGKAGSHSWLSNGGIGENLDKLRDNTEYESRTSMSTSFYNREIPVAKIGHSSKKRSKETKRASAQVVNENLSSAHQRKGFLST
ncbi:hypothetical protein BT69DRAFT_1292292 [Atractiella rhizophila]|nr:hypothetical protein BT69DRAFT_1292292 [Atractiella rhizophila]